MIREIVEGRLFVGNARDARSLEVIGSNQITVLVDLAAEDVPASAFRDTVTIRVPLRDDGENRSDRLEFVIRAVLHLLTGGERILVACSAGQSRSPLIAAAALCLWCNVSLDDEVRRATSVHPTDVSPAFYSQVQTITAKLRSGSFGLAGG